MLINAILDQAMKSGGADAAMAGLPVTMIAIGALDRRPASLDAAVLLVRARGGDAWIINAVVSTIAFPFWAYLMGAVAFANHHDGNLAVILVLTFTAVSGLVAPLAAQTEGMRERACGRRWRLTRKRAAGSGRRSGRLTSCIAQLSRELGQRRTAICMWPIPHAMCAR